MPRKPKGSRPAARRASFTIKLGGVAIRVNIPLSSAANASGIISRPGPMLSRPAMPSATGMKIATTPVELMKAPSPAIVNISSTNNRVSLAPATPVSQTPIRLATPVRTRPSPTTNNPAISITTGSPKPASASDTGRMPPNISAKMTSRATMSGRSRSLANSATVTASTPKTNPVSEVINGLPPYHHATGKWGSLLRERFRAVPR